jgi:pilus assembly protein CpaD
MIANMKSPLVLLALASVALTGCASGRDSITVGAVPDDYRTRHPIVINQVEQTLDVAIATGVRTLDRPTQSNIEAFANGFAGSGGGVIIVLEPAGSANSQSVIHVRDDIIAAITAGGVQRHQIAVQTYDASQHGAAAPVRLSYQAVDAEVGECGKWFEDLAHNPENKQYHDFGCSTQSNLSAIIANPNDLMGPRAASPIDPIQRAGVIQRWQDGSQPIQSEVEY